MPDTPEVKEAQCPHTALTPHWDQPGDMGKKELAMYTCESCHQRFNYAEAQQYLNNAPSVMTAIGDADRR